jgi:hypothetical protein
MSVANDKDDNEMILGAVHRSPEYRRITAIVGFKNIKYVAFSSQGSNTGQLDFGNWLGQGSTTG